MNTLLHMVKDTYQHRRMEERYSRRVTMEEIADKNGHNINFSCYFGAAQVEEEIDLVATAQGTGSGAVLVVRIAFAG
jgi:type I restriction enzyme M protein